MITTSKDGFCDRSDAEILNSLKDWVSSCDVDFKREAEKIDSAFAGKVASCVAAVVC